MRLKCNVLERQRERANPGQVMQLEGTAHWQNVARIKKRSHQTLFLHRLPFDPLLFTFQQQERSAAYVTLLLKQ